MHQLTLPTSQAIIALMDNFLNDRLDIAAQSNMIAVKLSAMANSNRLKILCALASGPLSVAEIQENVNLSQSAVSQHLSKMKKSGVVMCKKDAQNRFYYIEDNRILKLMLHIDDIFKQVETEAF
ncbi:MAG: ArsR family transcriptional regulator [Magnetococcales bacterium]|nr:ArsR family transcriptional regulator [Magnetococcales bacterium]